MVERFRLFVGQGVTHDVYGYGVIRKVGEKVEKIDGRLMYVTDLTDIKVNFRDGEKRVKAESLNHAVIREDELDEILERFETNGHLTNTKNTRTLILVGSERDAGRMEASTPPRHNISVPPSGLTSIVTSGDKCFHGNYIPYLSDHEDKALACSLCYPYKLLVKQDAEYLA